MSEEFPPDSQGSLIVFGAKQIRRTWRDDQWFFSIVDIIAALTDSAAPSKYWTALKRRERQSSGVQLSTICRQLKLTLFREARLTKLTVSIPNPRETERIEI